MCYFIFLLLLLFFRWCLIFCKRDLNFNYCCKEKVIFFFVGKKWLFDIVKWWMWILILFLKGIVVRKRLLKLFRLNLYCFFCDFCCFRKVFLGFLKFFFFVVFRINDLVKDNFCLYLEIVLLLVMSSLDKFVWLVFMSVIWNFLKVFGFLWRMIFIRFWFFLILFFLVLICCFICLVIILEVKRCLVMEEVFIFLINVV